VAFGLQRFSTLLLPQVGLKDEAFDLICSESAIAPPEAISIPPPATAALTGNENWPKALRVSQARETLCGPLDVVIGGVQANELASGPRVAERLGFALHAPYALTASEHVSSNRIGTSVKIVDHLRLRSPSTEAEPSPAVPLKGAPLGCGHTLHAREGVHNGPQLCLASKSRVLASCDPTSKLFSALVAPENLDLLDERRRILDQHPL
jgi:hypothetical protein